MLERLRPTLRLLFWLAATAILLFAIAPIPDVPGQYSDKVQHFAAFFVLAGLSASAYPERRLSTLWVCLLAYGVGIELFQGTAWIGRDADTADVLTDAVGALSAFAVIAVIRGIRSDNPAA